MNYFQLLYCVFGADGGHFFVRGACIHCGKKEKPDGNRPDSSHHQSVAGALPAATGGTFAAIAPGTLIALGPGIYPGLAGTSTTATGTGGSAAHPRVAEPLETVATEVLAERAWLLSQDAQGAPILESIVYAFAWDGPTIAAEPGPPNNAGTHGIYAQKSPLDECYKAYAVWGEVALSGVVVEGERGYRAERATIRKLHLRYLPAATPTRSSGGFIAMITALPQELAWPNPWDVAAALAARYACECDLDWLAQSTLPASYLDQ